LCDSEGVPPSWREFVEELGGIREKMLKKTKATERSTLYYI